MEKKEPPVFSKIEKIIIVSIFAILFLASIIVTAYLVSEGYEFKIFNLLSIFFIIITPLMALKAYEYRHKDISVYFGIRSLSLYRRASGEEKEYTYDPKFLRKYYLYNFLFLSQIPFHIISLVYVQEIMQLFVTVLILFFYPLVIEVFIEGILLLIKYCSKSAREERKAQAKIKEKIENEKTEELQKNFLDRY